MIKPLVLAVAGVTLLASFTPRPKEDFFGIWEAEESWGAQRGTSDHIFENEATGAMRSGDIFAEGEAGSFTLNVTRMSDDGRSFHAEWCGPHKCESTVGVIGFDGTIRMADHDGYFEGRLNGDRLEFCYLEASADTQIAGCHSYRKTG